MAQIHPIVENIFKGEDFKSILEVGCGKGILIKQFIEDKDIRVVGLEIDPENEEDFKKNFPQGQFILHDINNPFPFKDKEFDLVVSIGTLILIENVEPVLREMLRVGKKVALAELHDETQDERGVSMKVDPHFIRMHRDYNKLFSKFGITPTIEKVEDKWVIKS